MSAVCPQCAGAHTLDHCPNWRFKNMTLGNFVSTISVQDGIRVTVNYPNLLLEIEPASASQAQPEQAKSTAIALTDAVLLRIYQNGYDAFAGPKRFRHAANFSQYHMAGLRAIERHLTAPHGESDKTVGSV